MILAVDPGLATCGWAIVRPRTGKVVTLGVLVSSPKQHLDEWTDRSRRTAQQASFLGDIAKRHECTAIAAEAISCGGPPSARFSMGTSLCLSWGVLAGIAHCMAIPLFEVPPKSWQHAIVPEVAGRIDYDAVFAKLSGFVEQQASVALWSIKKGLRNHALDAVGVGLFAAFSSAMRISAPTEVSHA
jgi:Holliday junction resolvasome RuvABC endonuclease subunit